MIRIRDMVILLVLAVCSLILFILSDNQETEGSLNRLEPFVHEGLIQFDLVNKIEIEEQSDQVVFERLEGDWWQTIPFRVRMNNGAIRRILQTIQSALIVGSIEQNNNSDVIGLGGLSNSVTLFDGEKELSFSLGRKTLGGRAYAQLRGQRPVVIEQSMHRRILDTDHKRWRDAHLFPDFAIDGVRIERFVNGDRLVIDRSSGVWEMLQPVSTRIDQEALLDWVGLIATVQVDSYVVDEPKDLSLFGLSNPVASFSVINKDGSEVEILLGGRVSAGTEDRYVMQSGKPVISKVSWKTVAPLFSIPEQFIDTTGSAISPFDVKEMVIRSMGEEYKIIRELDNWTLAGIIVSPDKIKALLNLLINENAKSIAISPYPSEKEFATITFNGFDLLPLDTIRIAREADGRILLENGDNVLRFHPIGSDQPLIPFLQDGTMYRDTISTPHISS